MVVSLVSGDSLCVASHMGTLQEEKHYSLVWHICQLVISAEIPSKSHPANDKSSAWDF